MTETIGAERGRASVAYAPEISTAAPNDPVAPRESMGRQAFADANIAYQQEQLMSRAIDLAHPTTAIVLWIEGGTHYKKYLAAAVEREGHKLPLNTKNVVLTKLGSLRRDCPEHLVDRWHVRDIIRDESGGDLTQPAEGVVFRRHLYGPIAGGLPDIRVTYYCDGGSKWTDDNHEIRKDLSVSFSLPAAIARKLFLMLQERRLLTRELAERAILDYGIPDDAWYDGTDLTIRKVPLRPPFELFDIIPEVLKSDIPYKTEHC